MIAGGCPARRAGEVVLTGFGSRAAGVNDRVVSRLA